MSILQRLSWPWRTRPYDCEAALRRLDDYLDRQLSAKERRLVAAHLAICAECARKFRFETSFNSRLREKLSRIDVPPRFVGRLHDLLAAARDQLPH